MSESEQKLLEAFVLENHDLERLETLAKEFNIFEAIGAVRQELRHSDFLAYLLNSQENHGLEDAFLKKFLQRVISSADDYSTQVSSIDLDVWDLRGTEVLREFRDIDILLRNEKHRLAVVIENKIDTGEHSSQLERYWTIVSAECPQPEWNIIGVYLTPEGEAPSDQRYLPSSYGLIVTVLEKLRETRGKGLAAEVQILIAHYIAMLRRYIVAESEIDELCRKIYLRHKKALDLIFEHRPDQQATIQGFLQGLINETGSLELDDSTKRSIRFSCKDWKCPELKFEFRNELQSLRLKLMIGPGDEKVRAKLWEIAKRNRPTFKPSTVTQMSKITEILSIPFLDQKSYEDEGDEQQLQRKIAERWEKFLSVDLPKISGFIKNMNWDESPARNQNNS